MLQERTTHRTSERRPPRSSLFGDLGDRLARTFGGAERPQSRLVDWEDHYSSADDTVALDQPPTRFPVSRLGYDCAAVDEHLASLEREVAVLRAQAPAREAVAAEIEKIGEQTAEILKTAHEQARTITRDAQRQADRCISDAAANAVEITEEANRKLSQLDTETDAIWQERSRLLDDARSVASALFRLADEATARFPGEAEKADQPAPVVAQGAEGELQEELAPDADAPGQLGGSG